MYRAEQLKTTVFLCVLSYASSALHMHGLERNPARYTAAVNAFAAGRIASFIDRVSGIEGR